MAGAVRGTTPCVSFANAIRALRLSNRRLRSYNCLGIPIAAGVLVPHFDFLLPERPRSYLCSVLAVLGCPFPPLEASDTVP